ncbi:mammalian cell entry protein [Ideonella sp.]|uniref:MlaD family protein n=1 Tax=Ideonella sp. TaxID=1929293 RepID=UPI002B484F5A|nr:mammalian cell entry protein [Ideonella sp.]HJV68967.1 mammalian cell entry protein [Ideonella sp.]
MAETPSPSSPPPAAPPPVRNVEFKARLLLLLLIALVAGAAVYLMYARGLFEATQRLVLVAEDAEGVRVGMDLSFSGFPIGRVRRVELGADGNARILIDVPLADAHWLRQTSVFTLVRSVIGGTSLRAYTGVPTDPPLPDGAERKVLIGDTAAELQRVVTSASELLQNLNRMTAEESSLGASLANLKAVTERLKGPKGALGVLMGSDEEAARIGKTLDQTNALLARLDGLVSHADSQLFGPQGVSTDARAAIRQLDALLRDARQSLQQLDAVLKEAEGVAKNARVATTDLGVLRAEVESSLRKVQRLVDELNRKWPFAGEPKELTLP